VALHLQRLTWAHGARPVTSHASSGRPKRHHATAAAPHNHRARHRRLRPRDRPRTATRDGPSQPAGSSSPRSKRESKRVRTRPTPTRPRSASTALEARRCGHPSVSAGLVRPRPTGVRQEDLSETPSRPPLVPSSPSPRGLKTTISDKLRSPVGLGFWSTWASAICASARRCRLLRTHVHLPLTTMLETNASRRLVRSLGRWIALCSGPVGDPRARGRAVVDALRRGGSAGRRRPARVPTVRRGSCVPVLPQGSPRVGG